MEIRKLDNPWSDDLEALVQALPMCWSVEDEMHIKPVDIVRNNDFENPEIGVTHMKDLFLDVTHWRYTSTEDIGRIVHELIDDWYRQPSERAVAKHRLEASRRTCFPPELAAPYKPENVIEGGYAEIGRSLVDQWRKQWPEIAAFWDSSEPVKRVEDSLEIVSRLSGVPLREVKKDFNGIERQVRGRALSVPGYTMNHERAMYNLMRRYSPVKELTAEEMRKAARLVPSNHHFQRRAFSATLDSITESKDIRQEWASREAQRQARMREDAIRQTLGERYEDTAWRLRAGEAVDDVLSEEEIARIKESLIPVDAQIQRDMDALWPMGRIWSPTYMFKKGGTSGED